MKWYEVFGLVVGVFSLFANLFQFLIIRMVKRVYLAALMANRRDLRDIRDAGNASEELQSAELPVSLASIASRAETALNHTDELLTHYSRLKIKD